MIATSLIELSLGRAAVAFAALLTLGAADATAVFNTVFGLNDGNDYGRYAVGQNPLLGFSENAASLDAMIAAGAAQRASADAAATQLVIAGDTGTDGFGAAGDAATEALRLACANPADALRLLLQLSGFRMLRPGGFIGTFWAVESSGVEEPLADWVAGVPPIADAAGQELYVLTARAVLRLRLSAAASLARASTLYRPTSYQDAAQKRDLVCGILDALSIKCADLFDDLTANALDLARSAVFDDLTRRGAALAPVVTRQFAVALPAVVVAEMLYDDPGREGDLLARNQPPHPLFLQPVIEALAS